MARIIGDYTGTTWDDFLVLPELIDDKSFTPDDVDISTNLVGRKLRAPFLTAAMRSITGKDLSLAAVKLGMMPVVPRGLTVEKEVEIVEHVRKNAAGVGEIESEHEPTTVLDTDKLGIVVEKARRTGHSNIPVLTRKSDFVGMFQYKPSRHDHMDFSIPITKVMQPYSNEGDSRVNVCRSKMSDEDVKKYLRENNLRFVPVLDGEGRLDRLIFFNLTEYNIGAAIDTHPGWKERTKRLVEAGANMIFIDTSDAHKPFACNVIEEYKKMFPESPPICGGNVVTPEGFDYLVEAGADAVKIGMGPGSICTTNQVLGVGAPPFWSLVEIARRRDEYAKSNKYIPVIADGGIENTDNIAVALTHADAIMGGKIFGCFWESEGDRIDRQGKVYPRDKLAEDDIVGIKIFGEGSEEARIVTGNMKRYATPISKVGVTTFQGVSGWIKYRGRFKPGVEGYMNALKETVYHAGASDLETYRKGVVLIRLSERAKSTAAPHGIEIISD